MIDRDILLTGNCKDNRYPHVLVSRSATRLRLNREMERWGIVHASTVSQLLEMMMIDCFLAMFRFSQDRDRIQYPH